MKLFAHPPGTNFASLVVFISASLWGLYWVPLRYLEELGIGGGYSVALLNLPGAVVLLPLVLWQWQRYRGHITPTLMIGVLTGFGLALYTSGLLYSSVVRVTLLFYVTPVWATLIGIFWLGEKAGWQRWLAIAAGLSGLTLMVSGGDSASLNIGDFFALLSGIFWAIGAAMIKHYDDVPLAGMTMFQFICTSLGAIIFGLAAPGAGQFDPVVMPQAISVSVAISLGIILPTVWLIFWAQKFLFPGRAGLLMMSEVLVAVISASIFLPEEQMSLIEWLGAVLIISACLIEILTTPEPDNP